MQTEQTAFPASPSVPHFGTIPNGPEVPKNVLSPKVNEVLYFEQQWSKKKRV